MIRYKHAKTEELLYEINPGPFQPMHLIIPQVKHYVNFDKVEYKVTSVQHNYRITTGKEVLPMNVEIFLIEVT